MGRKARKYSKSGLYHVVYRGISRQNIFNEEADYIKKINILSDLKEEMEFQIHAYCLMTNHVHLLIKEDTIGDISVIMKRLLVKYAFWFNKKYDRSGTLFANRYKSQPLEKESHLISVVRYIHQNPIKANLSSDLKSYKWSSYSEYLHNGRLVDTQHVLGALGGLEAFRRFNEVWEETVCEVTDKVAKSEECIRKRIIKIINGRQPYEIASLPKMERNKIIAYLRETEKLSIRQIERATGISRGTIARIK